MEGPSDPPLKTVDLPGGPAAYTDEGEGAVFILVHGLPGSVRDYRWLAPRLAPFARVIRMDLPGFGETPVASGPDASPLGRARFVLALMDALDIERAVIVGHSMGGVVACAALSIDASRFDGLVLLSSPGVRAHLAMRRMPFRTIKALMARPLLWRALRPLRRRLFALMGFKGYPDSALDRTLECVARTSPVAHARRVRALTLPTAAAWADDDPLIEAPIMKELADVCPPGPRLHFDEGGHNIQKTHAAAIAEALEPWIRTL